MAQEADLDLEIEQHERFQRREWLLVKVGWAVLGTFVPSGLVGLLARAR